MPALRPASSRTLLLRLVLVPLALLFPVPSQAQQPRSEVLVIGSLHAPPAFFLEPGYTPAHVRAALEKYQPTIVGVESNPLWFSHGMFADVTYEAQYTAVPWAVERGIPVYGIDWQNIEALGQWAKRGLEIHRAWRPDSAGTLASFRERAQRLAGWIDAILDSVEGDPQKLHRDEIFAWYNSVTFARTTWAWWDSEGRTDPAGAERGHRRFQILDTRDAHIVDQVLAVLRRYPGSRMAIIIGKSHKPNLDRRLASHDEVRVVQLQDVASVTAGDAEAAWRPIDAIAGLRESLDHPNAYYLNPDAVDRERVARLLARLEAAGIDSDELRYLRARYLVLEKRYDEARSLLEPLTSATDVSFSYRLSVDWGLSVGQMARLALGQLHDLRGDRERALTLYQSLLTELELTAPSIPADEVFTDAAEWATHGRAAFWRIFSNHAARDVLHMLLREPYSL